MADSWVLTVTPARNATTHLAEGAFTRDELAKAFTTHEDGDKDGDAFVPGHLAPCPVGACRGRRTPCAGGPHRLNENVRAINLLALDVDDATTRPVPPFFHWWYETHSSTPERPKWRLVFPLAHPYTVTSPADWAENAWPVLVQALGAAMPADRACRDACRLYYLPRKPPGTQRTAGTVEGPDLDWRGLVTPHSFAQAPPLHVANPITDPRRPVNLQRFRDKLAGIQKKTLQPLARALLDGTPLVAPPRGRAAGEPPRYYAWRSATAMVSRLAEGWEAPEALLPLFQGTYEAMVADEPEDHTPREDVLRLLESAMANKATFDARIEAATKANLNHLLERASPPKPEGAQDPKAEGEGASEPAPEDESWKELLSLNAPDEETGARSLKSNANNVGLLLRHLADWKGALRFNELSGKVELRGRPLEDTDDSDTADWFTRKLGWELHDKIVRSRMIAVAMSNRYNPLKDYLNGLKWDGVTRVRGAFEKYFHCRPDPKRASLTTATSEKWFISAVARGLDPGCQVDTMLVLEGEESGEGKTSALRILAGAFFSGAPIHDVHNTDARINSTRHWIQEMGELDAAVRSEMTALKDFISRREEDVRLPYGKSEVTIKRPCVLAGTTNVLKYMQDPGRNRRYWPIACEGKVDLVGLERDRNQLWAEAVALYRAGVLGVKADGSIIYKPFLWWFSPDEEKASEQENESRAVSDIRADAVRQWFESQEPEKRVRQISGLEVYTLILAPIFPGAPNPTHIGLAMKRLGFKDGGRETAGGKKIQIYETPDWLLETPRIDAAKSAAWHISRAHLTPHAGGLK